MSAPRTYATHQALALLSVAGVGVGLLLIGGRVTGLVGGLFLLAVLHYCVTSFVEPRRVGPAARCAIGGAATLGILIGIGLLFVFFDVPVTASTARWVVATLDVALVVSSTGRPPLVMNLRVAVPSGRSLIAGALTLVLLAAAVTVSVVSDH